MFDQMLLTIKEHNLLKEKDTVLVGVSGGADSMALLQALINLNTCDETRTYDLRIVAVHVHHGIRGQTADRDLNFVRTFCQKNNIEFEGICENVPEHSKRLGISIEDAGRRIRYQIFDRLSEQYSANAVALAHHKDDLVETFLMNLFRGAGVDGLASIEYFRKPNIIRPLLDVSKSEIYLFCERQSLSYIEDETNSSHEYFRNRVRGELLPYLRNFFDYDVENKIYETALRFKDEKHFWHHHISQIIEAKVKPLSDGYFVDDITINTLTVAEKRALVRALTTLVQGSLRDLNQHQVDQVIKLNRTGTIVDISEGCLWTKYSDGLAIIRPLKVEHPPKLTINTLKITQLDMNLVDENEIAVDADKIMGKIHLRHRKEGDRFFPMGSSGSKKLKDYMIDLKIPRHTRDNVWLVCDEEKIIWIPGYKISDRVKVTDATQNVVMIRL